MYIALAVLIRLAPKRHAGNLAPNDIIALIVVGDLASSAILGDATSAPDVLLMIGVVLLWDYLFNLLEYYVPRTRRIAQHTPTLLIHNGKVLESNLRKEKLTEEELAANLRKQGVGEVARVKQAILEVDGHISVVNHQQS